MAKKKNKGGRPTKFLDCFSDMARRLARDGKTMPEIADFFGVSRSTLYKWMEETQKFSDSLKQGADLADDLVEASLYKRAIGYVVPETKTFLCKNGTVVEHEIQKFYPPDVVAQIFWLKNRRPERWRDKQPDGDSGELNINLNYLPRSKRGDGDPDAA